MNCSRRLITFLLLLSIVIEVGLLVWLKKNAPNGYLGFIEVEDVTPWYSPDTPAPPYTLDEESKQEILAKVTESGALSVAITDFDRIVDLRNWTRQSCPKISRSEALITSKEILDSFEKGNGGACGALAQVYCATLMAHGYKARIVQLLRNEYDVPHWNESRFDTHVTVEVFSSDDQKWICMDPTFNCWFRKPDSLEPLSVRELQLIAMDPASYATDQGWVRISDNGMVISESDGFSTLPTLDTYYIDPIQIFRNPFLLYYDAYHPRLTNPIDKLKRIFNARYNNTEKLVWLLPPGRVPDYMVRYESTVNWLPVVILVLLLLRIGMRNRRQKSYRAYYGRR
jgi:hypothetical protein